MKNSKQNSLSLWVAIFTLISVVAIGAMYLSLERSHNSSMSSKMATLTKDMQMLTRQNLDLSSRIANLESPEHLKMRLGSLSPISENILILQSYNEIENKEDSKLSNVALGYSSTKKIGSTNTIRQ